MNGILSAAANTIDGAGRMVARVAERVAQTVPSVQSAARDAVDLAAGSAAGKAGAAMLRTASEVLGSVVNLFA